MASAGSTGWWPAPFVAAAVVVLAALFIWQRGSYVDYAEGVYLSSARLTLHGAVPYRDFVAAHPPLLFYTGAGLLAIWDSLDGVRVLLSLVTMATGGLVAVAVMRLTGSGTAAAIAGVLAIVAPWSLHEHATLMPETFAAPLLMASALLASRRSTAPVAGLIAAVAVGFKWPYLLAGLALALTAAAPRRYLAFLLAGFATGVLASFALFGAGDLYRQLVVAQEQLGWHTVRYDAGLAAQATWNLAPLLILAAFGVRFAARSRDPALLRSIVALALATIVLVATIAKTGTYLNTIVPVEPPLVALATAGTVWLFGSPRARGSRRRARMVVCAAWILSATQVISFVARPTHPGLFVRPLSAPAHAWIGKAQVAASVRQARACPPGAAYSGAPFVAFVARRRLPANEPDQFLMTTPAGARAAAAAARDSIRCPG